jgi:hypothetical protein
MSVGANLSMKVLLVNRAERPKTSGSIRKQLPCEKGCQCCELAKRITVEKRPAMPLCLALRAWSELLCLPLLREFGVDIVVLPTPKFGEGEGKGQKKVSLRINQLIP